MGESVAELAMGGLAMGGLGVAILSAVGVLVLAGSVLRERRVGDDGTLDSPGTGRSLLGLAIGLGLAAALIAVLLRFDAVLY